MKQLSTLKISNLGKKHQPNTTWSKEARIAAVSQYLVLGNMSLVSSTTGIPYQLLRAWKQQPWWAEVVAQIRSTDNIKTDNKLSKIVDKSLDAVLDRVENGEYMYDAKSGDIKRRPASMKDIAKVSVDLLTKRELLRGNATSRTEQSQISVEDHLKALALEFAKWKHTGPTPVIIDTTAKELDEDDAIYDERETRLQEGSGEVYEQTFSSEEEDGTERSESEDGESWFSSQG